MTIQTERLDWSSARREFRMYGNPFPCRGRISTLPAPRPRAAVRDRIGRLEKVHTAADLERMLERSGIELRLESAPRTARRLITNAICSIHGYGTNAAGDSIEWVFDIAGR